MNKISPAFDGAKILVAGKNAGFTSVFTLGDC